MAKSKKPAATLLVDEATKILPCGCRLKGTIKGDVLLYYCPMHAAAATMWQLSAEVSQLDPGDVNIRADVGALQKRAHNILVKMKEARKGGK